MIPFYRHVQWMDSGRSAAGCGYADGQMTESQNDNGDMGSR